MPALLLGFTQHQSPVGTFPYDPGTNSLNYKFVKIICMPVIRGTNAIHNGVTQHIIRNVFNSEEGLYANGIGGAIIRIKMYIIASLHSMLALEAYSVPNP